MQRVLPSVARATTRQCHVRANLTTPWKGNSLGWGMSNLWSRSTGGRMMGGAYGALKGMRAYTSDHNDHKDKHALQEDVDDTQMKEEAEGEKEVEEHDLTFGQVEEAEAEAGGQIDSRARTQGLEQDRYLEHEEGEEGEEENMHDEEDDEFVGWRTHPLVEVNKFAPFPSTVFLPPSTFIKPISTILKPTSIKHVRQTAETLFTGPGLPHSPLTPAIAHSLAQKPVPLCAGLTESMTAVQANAVLAVSWPPMYAASRSALVQVRRRMGNEWIRKLATKKRMGPKVLDIGSGGAGVLAWNEIVRTEGDIWTEEMKALKEIMDKKKKKKDDGRNRDLRWHSGSAVIVAPSHHLREKVSQIMAVAATASTPAPTILTTTTATTLGVTPEATPEATPETTSAEQETVEESSGANPIPNDDADADSTSTITSYRPRTTFISSIPRFDPDSSSSSRSKQDELYDVILVPYVLWAMPHNQSRRATIRSLWQMLNPDGGVIVVIEKGTPRGFEVVAEARRGLLEQIGKGEKLEKDEKKEKKKEKNSAVAQSVGVIDTDPSAVVDPSTSSEIPKTETPKPEKVIEKGTLLAPCPSPLPCPMYTNPGTSRNRKDFCHFSQRFIRPPFLQRVLGASKRNHADVEFSFVAFMKGKDLHSNSLSVRNPNPATRGRSDFIAGERATLRALDGYEYSEEDGLGGDGGGGAHAQEQQNPNLPYSPPYVPTMSLPRAILPPLKRKGHIILDVCTPSGTTERWTITKSRSRQAYRDGRKIRWGDLWPLGAKGRAVRTMRLGTLVKGVDRRDWDKGERMRRKAIKKLRHDKDYSDEPDFKASKRG